MLFSDNSRTNFRAALTDFLEQGPEFRTFREAEILFHHPASVHGSIGEIYFIQRPRRSFEMSNSNEVLNRVLGEIQSAAVLDTSAHSTYVSGVFED